MKEEQSRVPIYPCSVDLLRMLITSQSNGPELPLPVIKNMQDRNDEFETLRKCERHFLGGKI